MKRHLFFKLLSIIAISLGVTNVLAQEAKFDFIEGGKSLGEIVLTKKIEGTKIIYNYNSKVNYNLGGMVLATEENSKSIYLSDTLQSNAVLTKINAKPRFTVENNWDSKINKIRRTVNGKNYIIESKPITYSYLNLFFNAPGTNVKQVLYEISGKMFTVTKNAENVFTILDASNKKSTFYYNEKGVFAKAVITNSLGVFNILPKK